MVQNWKNQSVLLLLLMWLSGCTPTDTKQKLNMNDLVNMPTEQLFNLSVEEIPEKKSKK